MKKFVYEKSREYAEADSATITKDIGGAKLTLYKPMAGYGTSILFIAVGMLFLFIIIAAKAPLIMAIIPVIALVLGVVSLVGEIKHSKGQKDNMAQYKDGIVYVATVLDAICDTDEYGKVTGHTLHLMVGAPINTVLVKHNLYGYTVAKQGDRVRVLYISPEKFLVESIDDVEIVYTED